MSQTLEDQMPLVIRHVEVALRSGYSVKQSLEIVAKDMDGPAQAEMRQVLDALAAGQALPAALEAWRSRSPSPTLDLFVAALFAQLEAGGNLADKLQVLTQIVEKRRKP